MLTKMFTKPAYFQPLDWPPNSRPKPRGYIHCISRWYE